MQVGHIETIPFGIEHLDRATQLSREAGWPHRLQDWQVALHLSQGVVALDETGEVVGTALMTPYGDDCATINMVIVGANLRGRGVGRRLMDAVLGLGGERPLRLIATSDGLPLYEKLGFRKTGAVFQHQGTVGEVPAPTDTGTATAVDLSEITAIDRDAFGATRSALIEKLAEIGEFAVIRRNGKIAGFACIRAFGRGEVVGPVVATDLENAKALVSHFMSRRSGVFLRVDTGDAGLAAWLAEHSLTHAGGGIAMARPVVARPATSTFTTFALANQALG
ncbi:GNAT family N-acetyltransferase [Neorhizobium tomejilense]|uniref:GNAT family N-acetyltransferase n=1 Tax=Neorhizobium tomejilense TaxID=2093828 RepID=UPI003ECD04EC